MNYEKLKKRKYPTALALANGERENLPKMYDSGKSVREISDHYSTTVHTIVKALVFLGYDGPQWAKDECNRAISNNRTTPSNMKRMTSPLI